jgi:DnaK suppressor protein
MAVSMKAMHKAPPERSAADYREQLEAKASDVRRGLTAHRAAEIVRRPDEPLDFGDWCQKSHDEWLFLNQNRIEIELLREVEDALHRLDEGTYGKCQGCDEPISPKRLAAIPWAKYCVRCQIEGAPA